MDIYSKITNYISRYAPSYVKVSNYLIKKGRDDYEKILSEVWYNENLMLDMWMRTFISTSKPKSVIQQKLILKWFKKEDILKKIEFFYDEINNFSNYNNAIKKFIENKVKKWKSIISIKNEIFLKFPNFKNEILEILSEYNDDEALKIEIEKWKSKFDINDRIGNQKFYNYLMRKWFEYNKIKNFLNNN